MGIKQELIEFFDRKRPLTKRDMDQMTNFVLMYFGFLDGKKNTYDEVGIKNGVKRQRVEQVIAVALVYLKESISELDKSKQIRDIFLQITQVLRKEDLISKFREANLFEEGDPICVPGLLDFLNEIGLEIEHSICDLSLSEIKKYSDIQADEDFLYFPNQDVKEILEFGFHYLRELTRNVSYIVNAEDLLSELGTDYPYIDLFFNIIESNPKYIVFYDQVSASTYISINNERNRIITPVKRIYGVANKVHINELCLALQKVIKYRKGKDRLTYFPISALKKYVEVHHELIVDDNQMVTYLGDSIPLARKIELDTIEFLSANKKISSQEIEGYLKSKGHSNSNIQNVMYQSPLVVINKELGRGNFLFSVIGKLEEKSIAVPNEEIRDIENEGENGQNWVDENHEELKRIGEKGEVLINLYLQSKLEKEEILEYLWKAKENPFAPYDFLVKRKNGDIIFIDVKTTKSPFAAKFFLSKNEIKTATEESKYYIFRVYDVDENPRMRISENIHELSMEIIEAENAFPNIVEIMNISIRPAEMKFSPEVSLQSFIDGKLPLVA